MNLSLLQTYAALGWHVHPLTPGGKEPITPRGHLDASADSRQIEEWFEKFPGCNWGLALEPSGLAVLDVDVHNANGFESLNRLPELPPTFVQETPSGGRHYLFKSSPELAKRKIGFLPGLDWLGKGYIVVEPSQINGKPYQLSCNTDEPAPSPQLPFRSEASSEAPTASQPIAEGQRNNALFGLATRFVELGLDEDQTFRLLCETNRNRCRPPINESEVALIVRSAFSRVKRGDVLADVFVAAAIQNLPDTVPAVLEKKEARRLSDQVCLKPQPVSISPTGTLRLDQLIGGGFASRHLVILTAPPGAGKSSWVTHTALKMQKSRPVLHISTELETSEVTARYAASVLGVSWTSITEGRVPWAEVQKAVADLNIFVIGSDLLERGEGFFPQLEEQIRKIGGSPLVIVDYIQQVIRGVDADNIRLAVGQLSEKLLGVAKQYDLTVLGVSSIGREFYSPGRAEKLREFNDPSVYLTSAKESGEIDFDAGTVLFLDSVKEEAPGVRAVRIAVAKARRGQTGFVSLKFFGATGRFEETQSESFVPTAKGAVVNSQPEKTETELEMAILKTIRDHNETATSIDMINALVGGKRERTRIAVNRLTGLGVIEIVETQKLNALHRWRKVHQYHLTALGKERLNTS